MTSLALVGLAAQFPKKGQLSDPMIGHGDTEVYSPVVTSPIIIRPISLAGGELIVTSFAVVGPAKPDLGKAERFDDWSQDHWPWRMGSVDWERKAWRAVTTDSGLLWDV